MNKAQKIVPAHGKHCIYTYKVKKYIICGKNYV